MQLDQACEHIHSSGNTSLQWHWRGITECSENMCKYLSMLAVELHRDDDQSAHLKRIICLGCCIRI